MSTQCLTFQWVHWEIYEKIEAIWLSKLVKQSDVRLGLTYSKDLFYSYAKSFTSILGKPLYLSVRPEHKYPKTNQQGTILIPRATRKYFMSLKHEIAHHLLGSDFNLLKQANDPLTHLMLQVLEDRRIEYHWGKMYPGDEVRFDQRRADGQKRFYNKVKSEGIKEFKLNVDNTVNMVIEVILHELDYKATKIKMDSSMKNILEKATSGRDLTKTVDCNTAFAVANQLSKLIRKEFPEYEQGSIGRKAQEILEQYTIIFGSSNEEKMIGRGKMESERINELRKEIDDKKAESKTQEELNKLLGSDKDDEDIEDNGEEQDENGYKSDLVINGDIDDEDMDLDDEDNGEEGNTGTETDQMCNELPEDFGSGDPDEDNKDDEKADIDGDNTMTGGEGSDIGDGSGGVDHGDTDDEDKDIDNLLEDLGLEDHKREIEQAQEFQKNMNEVIDESLRNLYHVDDEEDEIFSKTKMTDVTIEDVTHKEYPNPAFVKHGQLIANQLKKFKASLIYGSSMVGTQINMRRLIDFKVTGKNPRIFDQKIKEGTGMEIVILVDVSSSMNSSILHVVNVCSMIYKAATMVKNLEVSVYGFRSSMYGRGSNQLILRANNIKEIMGLASECGGSTPMLGPVRYCLGSFKTPMKRLFIMITDGEPTDGKHVPEAVRREFNAVRKNIKIIGYYIIGNRQPRIRGRKSQDVRSSIRADLRGNDDGFTTMFGSSGWYIPADQAPLVIKNLIIRSLRETMVT